MFAKHPAYAHRDSEFPRQKHLPQAGGEKFSHAMAVCGFGI